jgi:hypothetical protein
VSLQIATFCCSVDIYSSHEGQLYCKPHFRELFKPKAVVDEDVEPRKFVYDRWILCDG